MKKNELSRGHAFTSDYRQRMREEARSPTPHTASVRPTCAQTSASVRPTRAQTSASVRPTRAQTSASIHFEDSDIEVQDNQSCGAPPDLSDLEDPMILKFDNVQGRGNPKTPNASKQPRRVQAQLSDKEIGGFDDDDVSASCPIDTVGAKKSSRFDMVSFSSLR